MSNSAQPIHRFHEASVQEEEISPSVRIQRRWRTRHRGTRAGELVYTENLWAAINNTLAGCIEFRAWQNATQWVLVTDGQRGEGAAMLGGCEAIAAPNADVHMVDTNSVADTLADLATAKPTVFVLAIESNSIATFAETVDEWLQQTLTTNPDTVPMHLLWLPSDRAAQSFPIHTQLESLCWESLTVACDLSTFSTDENELKASLATMLRAAVFIDPQFAHWLEGNLSAMAELDEEVHRRAIMRTANTLFTMKRRRGEEPDVPMPFTDTAALRYSVAADPTAPAWKIQTRQLMLDIAYASHTKALSDSAVERVKRMMNALNLLEAAADTTLVNCDDPDPNAFHHTVLVLTDIGNAQFSQDFDLAAWHQANR